MSADLAVCPGPPAVQCPLRALVSSSLHRLYFTSGLVTSVRVGESGFLLFRLVLVLQYALYVIRKI